MDSAIFAGFWGAKNASPVNVFEVTVEKWRRRPIATAGVSSGQEPAMGPGRGYAVLAASLARCAGSAVGSPGGAF